MEQADRARRAAEQELNDANEAMSDLKVQNQSIAANKRRMEAELDNLKVQHFFWKGTDNQLGVQKCKALTSNPTLVVNNEAAALPLAARP